MQDLQLLDRMNRNTPHNMHLHKSAVFTPSRSPPRRESETPEKREKMENLATGPRREILMSLPMPTATSPMDDTNTTETANATTCKRSWRLARFFPMTMTMARKHKGSPLNPVLNENRTQGENIDTDAANANNASTDDERNAMVRRRPSSKKSFFCRLQSRLSTRLGRKNKDVNNRDREDLSPDPPSNAARKYQTSLSLDELDETQPIEDWSTPLEYILVSFTFVFL